MAESLPSLERSTLDESDKLPDTFCEPCYAASDKVKPVAGYCINCDEKLCKECFTSHKGHTLFRSHKLVKTSATPNIQPTTNKVLNNKVTKYMPAVALIIVAIILTSILNFEEMSELAKNIVNSQDVRNLKDDVKQLRNEFVDLMTKTENAVDNVKREDFTKKENIVLEQINKLTENLETLKENIDNETLLIAMKHAQDQHKSLEEKLDNLQGKFVDQTEKQAESDTVKREEFTRIENILMEQNNKLKVQLETLKKNNDTASLFIAMKHAQDQLQSLEDKLYILRGNFVDLMTKTEKQAELVKREDFTKTEKIAMEQINKLAVQLEPLMENLENENLFTAMKLAQTQLKSLEVKLDKLHKDNTVKKLKAMKPIHVKDIILTAVLENLFFWDGFLNKKILITDWENDKLKLIDTNQDKIISEIQLSGNPIDITKIKHNEFAVTVNSQQCTIQFISVFFNSMSKVREMTVTDGECRGLAYNDRDQTLIVTFVYPSKVKILDMKGTVIKFIEYDSEGDQLFRWPYGVALSPDMTSIYVTDMDKHSVTLMSLKGDVKAVYNYKTKRRHGPCGVYVHTSGLVYLVGQRSHTVHELDPESGEFKVILEEKDGLNNPRSISYFETEDKMYIGMQYSSVLKVFQMK